MRCPVLTFYLMHGWFDFDVMISYDFGNVGQAAGGSAAARCRRLNEEAEIVLFEKSVYPSFANCGVC
jgi:hypothetical protein